MYMHESALKIPKKYKKLVDTDTLWEKCSGIIFNSIRIGIKEKEIHNIINEEICINHLFFSVFLQINRYEQTADPKDNDIKNIIVIGSIVLVNTEGTRELIINIKR